MMQFLKTSPIFNRSLRAYLNVQPELKKFLEIDYADPEID